MKLRCFWRQTYSFITSAGGRPLLSYSMKSEEYSASWDSDIHSGDILFELNELNEIANFKSEPLDQRLSHG